MNRLALMAHASNRIMRAAGHAASSEAVRTIAQKMAETRFAELTGEKVGDIVITGGR